MKIYASEAKIAKAYAVVLEDTLKGNSKKNSVDKAIVGKSVQIEKVETEAVDDLKGIEKTAEKKNDKSLGNDDLVKIEESAKKEVDNVQNNITSALDKKLVNVESVFAAKKKDAGLLCFCFSARVQPRSILAKRTCSI